MALIVGGTDNKGVVQTVWFVSLVKYKKWLFKTK